MALSRIQALQVLGLKTDAMPEQITDAYHKLHPAAERAALENKPERLRRLDEAYRILMTDADVELKRSGMSPPGMYPSDAAMSVADINAQHERLNPSGGGLLKWVILLLLLLGGAAAAAYLGLIPGLPKIGG